MRHALAFYYEWYNVNKTLLLAVNMQPESFTMYFTISEVHFHVAESCIVHAVYSRKVKAILCELTTLFPHPNTTTTPFAITGFFKCIVFDSTGI